MDRAEKVAWLRNKVCQYRNYAKQDRGWYIPVKPLEIEAIELQEIADELERLGHIEAEHQGCAPAEDLGGLPDLVKQWLSNREGKTFRDCGATAAVCRVLRDHERLVREHQGCTENMASLVRERDGAR